MRIGGRDNVYSSEPLRPGSGVSPSLLGAIVAVLIGGLVASYLTIAAGLPENVDLKSYKPKSVSTFYAEDGSVLSMFYHERRIPVALNTVPKHVQQAFVAAEDTRFFKHSGVDPWGIVRALLKDLETRNFAQGGSTITQQVARSIFLSKEKTVSRKLREMLLALRIERSNSKPQILETYLNEIYLGRGAYGIQAAAQAYFGKDATDLTISEAAYIAGLASSPSRYTPERIDEAKARRDYVLNAMLKSNYVSPSDFKKASDERLAFPPNAPDRRGKDSYFTEAVRRYIISQYGEKALYEDGLSVWTTLNKDLQARAEQAVVRGVKAWEQRQGRPAGLIKRLSSAEIQNIRSSPLDVELKPGASVQGVILSAKETGSRIAPSVRQYELTVMVRGGETYRVLAESRHPYRKNDLVAFMVKRMEAGKPVLKHNPLPPVQGALVSIENSTGYVNALVGGTGEDKSGFNRGLQALRQPGSAFKPIVYSAALEWGRYDPRTIIIDEPIVVRVSSGRPEWIPENPDERFQGPVSFQAALVKSRNIPTVKIAMDLGLEAIIQMASNMGIKSTIKESLSSALGASEVSPLDLTSAYSVFPNLGVKVAPVLVRKITDRAGNVLENNTVVPLDAVKRAETDIRNGVCVAPPDSIKAKEEQANELGELPSQFQSTCRTHDVGSPKTIRVMSPQTAHTMLSMLREVTVSGTASSVRRMARSDLAGKTGTTNDYADAWFIGFNPKYTTGVWIGYDMRDSLGNKEFGAKAALPVWMEYMSYALRNDKPGNRLPTPGIEFPGPTGLARPFYEKSVASAGHFAPAMLLKQICPIDAAPIQLSGDLDAYLPWFGLATAGIFSNSGLVKVLSPRGKTLGLAVYTRDEQGNIVLGQLMERGFGQ